MTRRERPILSPYEPVRLSSAEAEELRALVEQAWELRGTGYLRDASEAIVAWRERLPLSRLERRQGELARLVCLLRETDPVHLKGGGRDGHP